ncbi:MAG: tRNA (adenosine(37)-N6)-threonylcarbamoyltransferase complex dimerization subunit type 1 TsaB [Treponema sp.]|nr:tRNA (adenosine(37)-N6)-threonylcarbamoyltransferase complex dimerization subunit type 1 TsaB [Treponema sp.]
MNLLAIDSACRILSVAVSNGDELQYSLSNSEMMQSETIMDCIDSTMKKACLKPKDLNAVLCMKGPGSFTGLRIGYSIAKGLSLSLSIPFLPIPTLDCIAFNLCENNIILAVIESRKNAYYYSFFNGNERLIEDAEADSGKLAKKIIEFNKDNKKNIILTGYGCDKLYDTLPQEIKDTLTLKYENKGNAKELIAIAKAIKIQDNDFTEYLYSGPQYIRGINDEPN